MKLAEIDTKTNIEKVLLLELVYLQKVTIEKCYFTGPAQLSQVLRTAASFPLVESFNNFVDLGFRSVGTVFHDESTGAFFSKEFRKTARLTVIVRF